MDLKNMKEWIRQGETCAFLEDTSPVKEEWIKVYEQFDSFYEKIWMRPILLGRQQAKQTLRDCNWGDEYQSLSKPRVVLPGKYQFLSRKIRRYYPDLRVNGNIYEHNELGTVAKREKSNSYDYIFHEIIHLRRDILIEFLQQESRLLFIGIQNSRFSERTLAELSLGDDTREHAGETFRYTFCSRNYVGPYIETISTATQVLGKKSIRFD